MLVLYWDMEVVDALLVHLWLVTLAVLKKSLIGPLLEIAAATSILVLYRLVLPTRWNPGL